ANYYPKELAVITTLSAIFCGLVLAVYPISVVHLVDRIDKDHLVAGSSCLLMIYGIGSFIGPTAAGFTMEYMGAHALPTYYLIVLVIFTLIISVQLIRSRIIEKPEERESHYVAMVRTSPNILPMHPESEDILDASEEHCEVQRP
ncbi:MAG: MFS family permease, partial [Kangiellaceae bacterium]